MQLENEKEFLIDCHNKKKHSNFNKVTQSSLTKHKQTLLFFSTSIVSIL